MTVFYTAIIGDYDDLPTFIEFDPCARYVCFTDQVVEAPSPWEIVKTESRFKDSKMMNGYLKSNCHIMFGEEIVVWVDANLKDLSLNARKAEELLGGRLVAVLPHHIRMSVAQEMDVVIDARLDSQERVDALRGYYSQKCFTDDVGLSATMLLVRDMRDESVIEFNELWWNMVLHYSRRDQLTFDYALWATGLSASPIPVLWFQDNELFRRVPHKPHAESVRTVDAPVRLEIGPGDHPLEGYIGLDALGEQPFIWGESTIPYADESVDVIYASHVLEHVPWYKTQDALIEARRVLRSGGTLEIWVPDFGMIVDAYLKQECVDAWRKHNDEAYYMYSINGRIFSYGPNEENYHRAVFDFTHLRHEMQRAGFTVITRLDAPPGVNHHGIINMGVRGSK